MTTSQYNDIFQQVEGLLLQYAPQQVPIQEDTDLINDLGLDSLRVMDMLNEVEDVFDITYPINDLASLHTVKDFVLQIQKIVENS
ncbi:MAG: acyl carrier protein [Desulfuromonadales bacterium]|nr:acyl carrier protein [Desulfuromonadales bacterium]